MNSMQAVAVFPSIAPENLEKFKELAHLMLLEVQKQDSIVRYDLFFNHDMTSCTVLEEYSSPEGVIEHVKKNAALLAELTALGGKIQGSIFPMSQDGSAIAEIRDNWDSEFHIHFAGKN